MEFSLLNRLMRCGSEFSHSRIRWCGISETECLLCSFISSHPGCTQGEAVNGLRLDKTTVAKAMGSLEDRGLIRRERDGGDRRQKRLYITPSGEDQISGVLHLHDRWFEQILSVLTMQEQEAFEKTCIRLISAAEELLAAENGIERGELPPADTALPDPGNVSLTDLIDDKEGNL